MVVGRMLQLWLELLRLGAAGVRHVSVSQLGIVVTLSVESRDRNAAAAEAAIAPVVAPGEECAPTLPAPILSSSRAGIRGPAAVGLPNPPWRHPGVVFFCKLQWQPLTIARAASGVLKLVGAHTEQANTKKQQLCDFSRNTWLNLSHYNGIPVTITCSRLPA